MNWLIGIIGKLFDLLIGLLGGSALLVMLVVSVFTAVWALLLFKAVTPQDRLTETRDRLFGHIYEMGLYQDQLAWWAGSRAIWPGRTLVPGSDPARPGGADHSDGSHPGPAGRPLWSAAFPPR